MMALQFPATAQAMNGSSLGSLDTGEDTGDDDVGVASDNHESYPVVVKELENLGESYFQRFSSTIMFTFLHYIDMSSERVDGMDTSDAAIEACGSGSGGGSRLTSV